MKLSKLYIAFLFSLLTGFVALQNVQATSFQTNYLTCHRIPQLMNNYLVNHVEHKRLTSTLQNRTVDVYVKSLDPSKTLLLKKEATSFKSKLKTIFKNAARGNCKALDDINKLIIARYEEIENYVKTTVNDPKFKFNENVEILIDSDKRGYPKDIAERNAYYQKLINFQLSNYLEEGTKLDEAKKRLIHKYELNTKRAKELDRQDLYTTLLNSFTSALDPHSTYYSPEMQEEFRIQMSLSLDGIGATLSSEDGYTIVQEIIPGGAADRSNLLKSKDKIIAVSQDGQEAVSVIDMALSDVVRLIRGKKGTKVHLTILRQNESETKKFVAKITRDKIDLADQAAKMKIEEKIVNGNRLKMAVIDLPSFYGDRRKKISSYTDMKKLLVELKAKNVDGLLLDLSRNSGGLLDDAVRISGLFIKTGNVVATKSSNEQKEFLSDDDPEIYYNGPMVILTSRRSASAAEILPGALQSYHRSIVVGDGQTFGKGTVQSVLELPMNLGALKVTTGMFFIPDGHSTQHRGVISDIVIPSRYDLEDMGENTLDYSLKPQKISSFVSDTANFKEPAKHWTPVSNSIVKKLAKKSKARVKADKEFIEMAKKLEESKKHKGIIKLAELRAKKKEDNKQNEGKTNKQLIEEADAPQYNEALNILSDYILELKGPLKPALVENSEKKREPTSQTQHN